MIFRQKNEEFFLLGETAVAEDLGDFHYFHDQLFDLNYWLNYSCCWCLVRGCSV